MFEKVAVIGAGSWGTAVAAIAARAEGPSKVCLWARRPEVASLIAGSHMNPDYLPGIALPRLLEATSSIEAAVGDADLVVMAVPSHGFRKVLLEMAGSVELGTPVVSLSKGLEEGTHLRMTEVIAEVLPGSPAGVLSGPNLAREVVQGQPAATVVAMKDSRLAAMVQKLLTTPSFRVYTNPDVVGSEVAGATKNVIAIAVGICEGLGLGDSTRAALVTRGLAELGRLGVAMGGHRMTFAGLAGVGDLVATCVSPLSRNKSVGIALGRGMSLGEALEGMQMVAEGVRSAHPLLELAATYGVEMPIATQVAAVLDGISTPEQAVPALMQRPARSEAEGYGARGEDRA